MNFVVCMMLIVCFAVSTVMAVDFIEEGKKFRFGLTLGFNTYLVLLMAKVMFG